AGGRGVHDLEARDLQATGAGAGGEGGVGGGEGAAGDVAEFDVVAGLDGREVIETVDHGAFRVGGAEIAGAVGLGVSLGVSVDAADEVGRGAEGDGAGAI